MCNILEVFVKITNCTEKYCIMIIWKKFKQGRFLVLKEELRLSAKFWHRLALSYCAFKGTQYIWSLDNTRIHNFFQQNLISSKT